MQSITPQAVVSSSSIEQKRSDCDIVCGICTLRNESSAASCAACEHPLKIACAICTFKNEACAESCKLCGNPIKSTVKMKDAPYTTPASASRDHGYILPSRSTVQTAAVSARSIVSEMNAIKQHAATSSSVVPGTCMCARNQFEFESIILIVVTVLFSTPLCILHCVHACTTHCS